MFRRILKRVFFFLSFLKFKVAEPSWKHTFLIEGDSDSKRLFVLFGGLCENATVKQVARAEAIQDHWKGSSKPWILLVNLAGHGNSYRRLATFGRVWNFLRIARRDVVAGVRATERREVTLGGNSTGCLITCLLLLWVRFAPASFWGQVEGVIRKEGILTAPAFRLRNLAHTSLLTCAGLIYYFLTPASLLVEFWLFPTLGPFCLAIFLANWWLVPQFYLPFSKIPEGNSSNSPGECLMAFCPFGKQVITVGLVIFLYATLPYLTLQTSLHVAKEWLYIVPLLFLAVMLIPIIINSSSNRDADRAEGQDGFYYMPVVTGVNFIGLQILTFLSHYLVDASLIGFLPVNDLRVDNRFTKGILSGNNRKVFELSTADHSDWGPGDLVTFGEKVWEECGA